MTRKQRTDSVTAAVTAFENAGAFIPLPEGVELRDDEERTLWGQFTRARSRDSWRDFDLVILAKVVRLEADIRRYLAQLDVDGPLIENKRGTLIENPMFRVVDTLQRQQLALIRSMSLNQTATDARTLNNSAKAEREAEAAFEGHNIESLLAKPMPN